MDVREREDYGAHYSTWADKDHRMLEVIPGDWIEFSWVASWAKRHMDQNPQLMGLTCEHFRFIDLKRELKALGVEWGEHRGDPGLWVIQHPVGNKAGGGLETRQDMERGGVRLYRPRSLDHVREAIDNGNLFIKKSYPLINAADGVRVGTDGRFGSQPDFLSKASHTKIDAVVALTLAVGFAVDCERSIPAGPSDTDWDMMFTRFAR